MWQKHAADLGLCFRICAKSRFSHDMAPPLLADGDQFLTYLAVTTLGCPCSVYDYSIHWPYVGDQFLTYLAVATLGYPCSVYDYSIHWPDVGITRTEYLSQGTIGNLQE